MKVQLAINAVLAGTQYGLIAMSFALVSRTARFFHVAHGAVYTFGAYVAMSLVGAGLGLATSAIGGMIAGGLAGCVMEIGIFRPLRYRDASPEILLMASFGVLVVIQNLITLIWGDARRVLWIRTAEPGIAVLGGHITAIQVATVSLSLVIVSGLFVWSRVTAKGLMLRAVGDDPKLSQVRGIRPNSVILNAFAIASGAMAFSGIMQAMDTGLTPLMGFRVLLIAFAGALLGGLESDGRAFLGGVALGVLEQVAAVILPGQWYESIILILLVIVLVARGHRVLSAWGK